MKRLGQFIANTKGALGTGPDGQLAGVPLGHRGTRFKRRVRNVRDSVPLLQLQYGAGHSLCH